MTLTQIKPAGLSKPVDLADNEKIRLGTGNDLEIFHDGTNSGIQNAGGGLYITTASTGIFLRKGSSEELARFNVDGAVELYHDNSKKFETTNLGAKVTGELRLTDHLIMNAADNLRIYLGAGNDLQIYHDGSHSRIVNGTNGGTLRLQTAGSEEGIVIRQNGAVELYYDNSKKLHTHSGGITISGSSHMDDNNKYYVGSGDDLRILHYGSNSFIQNDTGNLVLAANRGGDVGGQIWIDALNGERSAKFNANGAAELYYDGSKKFNTDTNGITVTGRVLASGTSNIGFAGIDNVKLSLGTSDDLQIYHGGTHSYIWETGGGNLVVRTSQSNGGSVVLQAGEEDSVSCHLNGAVKLFYDNSKKLETTTLGVNVEGHIRFNNSTWTGEMAEGKIQTHSNNMYFQIPNTTNAEWIFRASDGVNRATINLNGSYSSSDERLKKDITTITSAVDTIKKLTGRSFTWKDTNKESFGLIAQEVETVLPDLVTNQQLVGGETNSDPYKSVNYAALTGHLVEAIKELSTKVAALEAA